MTTRRTLTTLVLALAVAACGSGTLAGVEEGPWRLVSGAGPGGPIPIVEGTEISLHIDGESWDGSAACNQYSATVTVDGDRLEVDEVIATEMACGGEGVMDSERAYLEAFSFVGEFERDDHGLILSGPDVRLVYEHVPPEPDAALADTEWRLASILHGLGPDGAISQARRGGVLQLGDDGRFTATTPCQWLGGRYDLSGDTLRLTDIDPEATGCPEDLRDHDQQVMAVLGRAMTVRIDGRRLLLTAGDQGLEYRAD